MRRFIVVGAVVVTIALSGGVGACSGSGGTSCAPPAWVSSACSSCMEASCGTHGQSSCTGFEDCYCSCEAKLGTSEAAECVTSCASSGCDAGAAAVECAVQKCGSVCGVTGTSGNDGAPTTDGPVGPCSASTGTIVLSGGGTTEDLTCFEGSVNGENPMVALEFAGETGMSAVFPVEFLSSCTYHQGETIPLSSSCLYIYGGLGKDITFTNAAQTPNHVAGSVELTEWNVPSGTGGMGFVGSVTLTFSSGAALNGSQSGTNDIAVNVSGSGHGNVVSP
jgi:hypothetical protein